MEPPANDHPDPEPPRDAIDGEPLHQRRTGRPIVEPKLRLGEEVVGGKDSVQRLAQRMQIRTIIGAGRPSGVEDHDIRHRIE